MLDRVDRTEPVAFVERGDLKQYHGMNPEFVKRARQKQSAARELQMKEEIERLKDRLELQKDQITNLRSLLKTVTEAKGLSAALEEKALEAGFVTVKDIIRVVARKHALRPSDILGPSRQKHIVNARFEAIAQAHNLRPDLSLPQLGRQFGGRDHTTILSALRKMGVDTSRSTASQ